MQVKLSGSISEFHNFLTSDYEKHVKILAYIDM